MKILHKTLILYLVLAVFPVFVAGFIATSKIKASLEDVVTANLTAVASSRAKAVTALADHHKQQVAIIAQQSALVKNLQAFLQDGLEGRQQYLNQFLVKVAADVADYESLTILSGQGKVVASTKTQTLGADYSTQSFLAGKKTWAFQPFWEQERLKIYLAKAITLHDKRIGTMLVVAKGNGLQQIMADHAGLGQTGDVLLVENDLHGGVIFITGTRDRLDEPLRQLVEPEQVSEAMKASLAGARHGLFSVKDFKGQPVLAVVGKVGGTEWGVVAKMNQQEVYASVGSMWLVVLLLMVVAALVAGAFAYVQAGKVTKSLDNLVHLAELIGQGELDQHMEVVGNDEMAEVAKAINSMVNRLRRSDWQQTMQLGELDLEVQQRRENESKLYDNHKLTDLAMKMARLGLWQVNLIDERVYLSAIMRQIYGIEAKDISLEESFAYVAEGEQQQVRQAYEQAIAGNFKPYSFQVCPAGGGVRQIHTLGIILLKDKQGNAVRAVGVSQDASGKLG